MTKKEKMILRKNIQNSLPKFDLGTQSNDSQMIPEIGYGSSENGVLRGFQYIKTARQDSPGADLSGKSSIYNNLKIENIVNTATNVVNSASFGYPIKQKQENTGAHLGNAAGSMVANPSATPAINTPATVEVGAPLPVSEMLMPAASSATASASAVPGASDAIADGAEAAGSAASSSGSSASASAAGAILLALGALQMGKGIFDVINVADQISKPAITDDEFDAMRGEQTMSGINGVQYKQMTGANMSDVSQIGAAAEGADIAAAANAGSGLGAGIGGTTAGILALSGALSSIPFLGWILGPAMAAIGAGVGAGVGASATDGKSEQAMAIASEMNNAIGNWNTHEASVSNSAGMRQVYDQRREKLHDIKTDDGLMRANNGKSPGTLVGDSEKYGLVATSDGVSFNKANAVLGRGEIAANTEYGEAFNVTYGDRGSRENVLAHLRGSDMVLSDSPKMIIPGSEMLVPGGLTPAGAGRSSAQRIQEINESVEKNEKYRDKHTSDFLKKQADKAKLPYLLHLQLLSNILDGMKEREATEQKNDSVLLRKKLPHYWLGKFMRNLGGYIGNNMHTILPNVGGLISTIGNISMYNDAKNEELAPAPEVHRSNADAQRAINAMKTHYNARPELQSALDINRFQNYANRHNGYTAGQRMAMDLTAASNYGNLVSRILGNAQNQSNQLWNAKQQALASLIDSDVARQMDANKYRHEWIARQNAARQKRIDTYRTGIYNNVNHWTQNLLSSIFNNKMLGIYSDEAKWKREHGKG